MCMAAHALLLFSTYFRKELSPIALDSDHAKMTINIFIIRVSKSPIQDQGDPSMFPDNRITQKR